MALTQQPKCPKCHPNVPNQDSDNYPVSHNSRVIEREGLSHCLWLDPLVNKLAQLCGHDILKRKYIAYITIPKAPANPTESPEHPSEKSHDARIFPPWCSVLGTSLCGLFAHSRGRWHHTRWARQDWEPPTPFMEPAWIQIKTLNSGPSPAGSRGHLAPLPHFPFWAKNFLPSCWLLLRAYPRHCPQWVPRPRPSPGLLPVDDRPGPTGIKPLSRPPNQDPSLDIRT